MDLIALISSVSDEVLVGAITFLIPIFFAVLKRVATPILLKREEKKLAQKKAEEKNRKDIVDALKLACNKSDREGLRVLIPQLIRLGELPSINVVLDYIEKEKSSLLKPLKKALYEECKRNKDTREIVQIAVANSPTIACELSNMMVKLA